MTRSSRDAAINVIRVCRDGISFAIGKPLRLPAYDGGEPPAAPVEEPPGDLGRCRIVAASPPPTRAEQPWEFGVLVDGGQFDPTSSRARVRDAWRQGVGWLDPIPDLDVPPGDTVVLDVDLPLKFDPTREMTFSEEPEQTGFLSAGYKQPYEFTPPFHDVGVNFYGEFTHRWTTELEPGAWVAMSLENFEPGRSSVDYLVQVQDCILPAEPGQSHEQSAAEPPREG